MAKKETLAKVKEKAWAIFSKYKRMKDCLRTTGCSSWGLCISCGKRLHLKLLQAGHFIPGRHNANLFFEKGCHAQCYNCNINLKGNTLNYMDALTNLYGDSVIEEIRSNDKKTLKFTIPDLKEMMEFWKKDIKEME